MCDGQAIVGDGDPRFLALQDAREHFAPGEHARTAVDNEFVGRQVGGEIVPLHVLDFQLAPDDHFGLQPTSRISSQLSTLLADLLA